MMQLVENSANVFIAARVHQVIDGKTDTRPITGFKVPEEGIEDIQKYLRESYVEERIRPLLKNCDPSIHQSVLESAQNAFFTDIFYHVHNTTYFRLSDDEKNIPYMG